MAQNTSKTLFFKKEKSKFKKVKAVYSFERFLDQFKENGRNYYCGDHNYVVSLFGPPLLFSRLNKSQEKAFGQKHLKRRFSSFQTPAALLYNKQPSSFKTTASAAAVGCSKRRYGPYAHIFLRKNYNYTRYIHPLLHSSLRGCTTVTGFKKVLYSKIKIQDHKLLPSYNRRKHNHSHYMVIENQLRNTSKAFQYIDRTKLRYIIASSLKKAHTNYKLELDAVDLSQLKTGHAYYHAFVPRRLDNDKTNEALGQTIPLAPTFCPQQKEKTIHEPKELGEPDRLILRFCFRSIPALVSLIEAELDMLVWRNLFNDSLMQSRKVLRHEKNQSVNETAVVLAKC